MKDSIELKASPSPDLSSDKIYAIFDVLSGDIVGNLIRAKNDAIVIRDFVTIIDQVPYPDDLQLVCLGSIPPLTECLHIMNGSSAKVARSARDSAPEDK
ncbi:nonstructural protein [Dipodfec virus UOA04_Rod_1027]|nr:nonstructural protein [Dipodfec virus UOA04_Rod_1027]